MKPDELPTMTGAAVRSYMKRYSLTQVELAEYLGCSRTMIIRWLAQPRRKIRRPNVLALAWLAEEVFEERLLGRAGV